MAGRILGMGDILALVDTARQVVDEEQQQALEDKIRAGEFTLDDFKVQLESFSKPGLMKKMMGLMPGMGEMTKMMDGDGMDAEGDARRLIGIINSMTPGERRNPKQIDPARRNRIASGSGVMPQQVNELVKQYNMVAPIMKDMAGQGMAGRMQAIQKLQQSGMMDPGGGAMMRTKKGTGKRLSPKEKAKLKKEKERALRRRRRFGQSGDN
jgi:signal recognition particle subunit SRP54